MDGWLLNFLYWLSLLETVLTTYRLSVVCWSDHAFAQFLLVCFALVIFPHALVNVLKKII